MLNQTISVIQQIVGFSLIPFIVFLIQKKKIKGFFAYIGLKRSNAKANMFGFLIFVGTALPLLSFAIFNDEFREVMLDPSSVTGKIRSMGFDGLTVFILITTAMGKTALAEEIFFRGFLAKRLISLLGFRAGNIVQSLVFGLLHTLIFLTITDSSVLLTVIFIFPAIGAWLQVYVNEKMADGSIIPGWIAHATANLVSYSFIGFIL